MSEPIFIPPNMIRFLHSHLEGTSFWKEDYPPLLMPVQWCESLRPPLGYFPIGKPPFKDMPIRAWTPCGQEIYWRLK